MDFRRGADRRPRRPGAGGHAHRRSPRRPRARAHRGAEPKSQCLRRRRHRRRPRGRGAHRRCGGGRRRRRSIGRHPHRGEGPRRRRGLRDIARFSRLRRRPRRRRGLPLRGATQGGRLCGGGEDQHTRTGMEGRHRQRSVRRDPQPLESGLQPGRFLGRGGGGHRLGDGPPRHGVRRGRLDPNPLVVLRVEWHQTVAGACPLGWGAGVGLARPVDQGTDGPTRGRRGPRPRRRRRARSHRHPLAAAPRSIVACRARGRSTPHQGGVVADARIRTARRRSPFPVRGRRRAGSGGRGPKWSRSRRCSKRTRCATG